MPTKVAAAMITLVTSTGTILSVLKTSDTVNARPSVMPRAPRISPAPTTWAAIRMSALIRACTIRVAKNPDPSSQVKTPSSVLHEAPLSSTLWMPIPMPTITPIAISRASAASRIWETFAWNLAQP
ncbi:unannotated protein [freshwater metagenome]|uniref:Unannotated protein n=1 Tax=freshwater metagenome TaxID=449393 RepID=A0A6J6Q6N3_9ZZZZ